MEVTNQRLLTFTGMCRVWAHQPNLSSFPQSKDLGERKEKGCVFLSVCSIEAHTKPVEEETAKRLQVDRVRLEKAEKSA